MIAKSWRSANVGVTQAPFAATGASRSGTTINIATAGGTGNLVIDTTATPLRTNYGIELFQVDGTPTVIQWVSVSGTNIIVTLTVDPGPSAVLTLDIGAAGVPNAKPGTAGAPGTNFRDSGAEPSLDGAPQSLWLCIDRDIPVT